MIKKPLALYRALNMDSFTYGIQTRGCLNQVPTLLVVSAMDIQLQTSTESTSARAAMSLSSFAACLRPKGISKESTQATVNISGRPKL